MRYDELLNPLYGRNVYDFQNLIELLDLVNNWLTNANNHDKLFHANGRQVIPLCRNGENGKPELTFFDFSEIGELVYFARHFDGENWWVTDPLKIMTALDIARGESPYDLLEPDFDKGTYYWSADATYEAFTI